MKVSLFVIRTLSLLAVGQPDRLTKWNSRRDRKRARATTRRTHCVQRRRPCYSTPAVPIEAVQDLLDHKHITTTQIYEKRRRAVKDSASQKMPI